MFEFYGDQTRWFIGTVIDNVPPYGMEGRVKVHIEGIHSRSANEVPHKDLPWAQVSMPNDKGGASGHGATPQLLPGTLVFGIFMDGKDSQLPLVLGSLHRTEIPNDVRYSNNLIPATPTEASERMSVAMQYFLNAGFRPHIVASIVGTMEYISDFAPEFSEGGRYGIMGWSVSGNRFKSLKSFSESLGNGYDYTSFDAQVAFILHELRGTKTQTLGRLIHTESVRDSQEPYRIHARQSVGNGSTSTFVYNYLDRATRQLLLDNIENVEEVTASTLGKIINDRS